MTIICFSHLRWDFVYQRPQHLMSRFAKNLDVIYIQEFIVGAEESHLEIVQALDNLRILTPFISDSLSREQQLEEQILLLQKFSESEGISPFIAWFYTPMALRLLTAFGTPAITVYDCMDELSAFKNAPADMAAQENILFEMADLVFTGGHNLYRAKSKKHHNIFPVPSSIDKEHFLKARSIETSPEDQAHLQHPIIGFFGVLDERFDIELLDRLARENNRWNFVIIGPVVKIAVADLPVHDNIHYLGLKSYADLPGYLSGWDAAIIPFVINESTRYISPTKTPEYLAGGVPVVATAIADIVKPYGTEGFVYIGRDQEDFKDGIEWSINLKQNHKWREMVDDYLKDISWDNTWNFMLEKINDTLKIENGSSILKTAVNYV